MVYLPSDVLEEVSSSIVHSVETDTCPSVSIAAIPGINRFSVSKDLSHTFPTNNQRNQQMHKMSYLLFMLIKKTVCYTYA